ncbi:beta-galactoside alpha-2,6-sialyltransferase 2 isoform X2 [Bacillus rossius redtenbacheri]|uniref:beta-galactoside alpha-2,6-sialyltransferase 2 isoform X2 n=1 Tax=Bacillus rossius redtenbacheri TaxID=93214 RepID=UPI002FDCDB6B
MRAVAVSVWIFMNLVLVGMCGYAYLLWSQYWQYVERQHAQAAVTSASRGGLVYYYHGALSATAPARYTRSQPRFPRPRHQEGAVRPSLLAAHRSQLVVQLRRVLLEESSAFRNGGANPYGVRYVGPRSSHVGHSPRELVCELLDTARPRVLSRTDQPFVRLGLAHLLPAQPLLRERYNSCAIVTNAGSLHRSGLGEFIDAHDLVVRFNHAPTAGHERDVGRKTSLRVLNSQVVSRPQFDFLRSPLYRGVRLLAWDPANYTSTLDQWYRSPDFDVFTPYFRHRALHPDANFHLLDPRSLWALWDYIQAHIPVRVRKNPPSSGFLGLALTLPHCGHVDMMEYVPSLRLTRRCHYWDSAEDPACTFGVWHPLAAEKLLALALNSAGDASVFSRGYLRILGRPGLRC